MVLLLLLLLQTLLQCISNTQAARASRSCLLLPFWILVGQYRWPCALRPLCSLPHAPTSQPTQAGQARQASLPPRTAWDEARAVVVVVVEGAGEGEGGGEVEDGGNEVVVVEVVVVGKATRTTNGGSVKVEEEEAEAEERMVVGTNVLGSMTTKNRIQVRSREGGREGGRGG